MKTLFVIDNMGVGGIATSLINLLPHYQNYSECDLLVFDNEYKSDAVPKNVNVLKAPKVLCVLGKSLKDLKKNHFLFFLLKLFFLAIAKLFSGRTARRLLYLFILHHYKYDCAVSFCHDNNKKSLAKGCNDFVLWKVSAPVKISWVHCDYASYGGYSASDIKMYSAFNWIIHVSNSCKNSFCSLFPSLHGKCFVIENFSARVFLSSATPPMLFDKNKINFLTVCRISEVKGLDRAVRAFARLKSEGFINYAWTIVGDGPELGHLQSLIRELGVDDVVRFVGPSNTPQDYMTRADFFLLPSRHEAAPMVFGECALAHLYVLSTKTCSAEELVLDRKIGFVCENSEEGIYDCLHNVIISPERFKSNACDFDNYSHASQTLDSFMRTVLVFEK